ncbi:MAG: class II aldolase/adducin family protein, partial [Solirubrobacteraceae bacterium]
EIPLLGTTHADLMADAVPLTRSLTAEEVDEDYEGATGAIIVEAIGDRHDEIPCILIRGHGPFCWGSDAAKAVEAAVTLEEVARLALLATLLNAQAGPLDAVIRDKHFERKHGADAYYGQ